MHTNTAPRHRAGSGPPRQTSPITARRSGYPHPQRVARLAARDANPRSHRPHGTRLTRRTTLEWCPSGAVFRQWPHSGHVAQRPRVRALCAAFPARSPLLPAQMCSLRAASVFLTSPPQQDKRARSGTLRLYYTSKQTTGRTNPETHWGNTRNPPGPEKHGPVPGFPPDPHSCLPPKTTVPAGPMTGESASTTVRAAPMTGEGADTTDPGAFITGESAHHQPPAPRRTCRTRKPARAREPGNPPTARGSPVPRTPPALPPPEGALGAP